MKTNVQTLNHSASHRISFNQWLQQPCALISDIIGEDTMTNRSVLLLIVFSLSLTASVICMIDQVQQYGWAAFFSMVCVNIVILSMRGGRHGR